MPFENNTMAPKKIAVIGAGISGMGAAHMLAENHRVTLFEAEPRLGGHARTVMAGKRGDQPVDTGFIVFNFANYPHLTSLFEKLDVPITKSEMSFAASLRGGRIEYGLASLGTLFAQRRNALNPKFIAMVRDILKFNAHSLEAAQEPGLTIGGLLAKLRLGQYFRDCYLLPFSGAIWSVPKEQIMDFPAKAMVEFFRNHGLLGVNGQHQWYTVQGGSIEYVRRLEALMQQQGIELRLGSPIAGVRRVPGGAEVRAFGAEWESFDEVVFATHSDVTLRLLSDPTRREKAALSAVAYQPNEVVLHADASVMPRRRNTWSSWNYAEAADKTSDRIDVTYWMNSLQPIPKDDPHFVTLNSTRPIREDLIYDQVTMHHPVFDLAALAAQDEVRAFNGTNRTWFCGAWMRNGFHEDGIASAVEVVEAIRAAQVVAVAAE